MSTEQTSNFWYFMLLFHSETSSSSLSRVTEQEENVTVEKWWHNHPRDCGKFWPPFWLSGCQRGLDWGQNSTVLHCTVGYGTMTHSAHPPFSHRHHWNIGCYPDGPPIFKLERLPFNFVTIWGSIWHQGAGGKMSPVSTSIQLYRWIHCIMGMADVILPIMRFLQVEMNYFGQKLFKNPCTNICWKEKLWRHHT